jgi:hypothetical protein
VTIESWATAATIAAGLAVAFRIGVWFCDRRGEAVVAVVRSFCREVAVYHRVNADGEVSDEEARALDVLAAIPGEFTLGEAETLLGASVRSSTPPFALVEALREHHVLRSTEGGLALYAGMRELVVERGDSAVRGAAFDAWVELLAGRAERVLSDERDAALAELEHLDARATPVLSTLLERGCSGPDDPRRASLVFAAIGGAWVLSGPVSAWYVAGPVLSVYAPLA